MVFLKEFFENVYFEWLFSIANETVDHLKAFMFCIIPCKPTVFKFILLGLLYLEFKFKCLHEDTVDSKIFARVLFSGNFAYAKFRENKTLGKWQNHSVVD